MEGGARDLIGDIHAQQRRRVLRRAALLVALAVLLLLIGLALKLFADRTARDQALETARQQFALGSQSDLMEAAGTLDGALVDHTGDERLLAGLALARVHLLAEFGEGEDVARESLSAVEGVELHDAVLARGIQALMAGDYARAREAVDAASGMDEAGSVAAAHEAWLAGMVALAEPTDQALGDAMSQIDEVLSADGSLIAYRRLLVGLKMHAGEAEEALAELDRTREQSFTHKGLAADEALYNAVLRQRLGGVASVSEQLLADTAGLSQRDLAHARLARAVVHVQSGELEPGLENLDQAWPELPGWDSLSRNLALELAMEAHDSARARKWAKEAGLDDQELEIYEAWALLSDGDVMKSLEKLAELPQDHPRVGYLQGLALVEQGRWSEAGPWLERANKLLPGRVELDVALARVQLREGDKEAALRKLKNLAEREPYAPRAWTGLGEAHLEVGDDAEHVKEARQAFDRAIEREHLPAEAMLRLAEIWDRRGEKDPEAPQRAVELLKKAAETNDRLPRYRERLAVYLANVGQPAAAVQMLAELVDLPGIGPDTLLTLCRLATEEAARNEGDAPGELESWLESAEKLGATPDQLARERARAAVLTGPREGVEAAHLILSGLLDKDVADVDARLLYSRAFQRMFDREKAVTAIRRGLQVTPPSAHGALYLEWARIESRTGGRRKASAHARVGWLKTLGAEHTPAELIEAADLATRMFLRDRKPKPAAQIARTLTEHVPYHSRSWVIRGRAQLAAQQAKEAIVSAEKAVELDEEDMSAHELIGDAVLRFGQKDRAKAAYEKALELAKGGPDEASIGEKLRKL